MDDTQWKNRYVLYLASGVIAVCFIYFFCVTFFNVPDSGSRYADIILGALIGSGFTAIMSWLYGSSKGSADKAATIDKQIDAAILAEKIEAKGIQEVKVIEAEKKVDGGVS
jgi:drug/metabolite transporter (DMT)-like permease